MDSESVNSSSTTTTLDDEYSSSLVGAIDEGTSSTRFLVFSSKTLQVITHHQIKLNQITPRPGWVEMDPIDILHKTKQCMEQTCLKLVQLRFDPGRIKAIGVTNQRETTIVWSRKTGLPFYNAIVWCDMRTEELADQYARLAGGKGAFQKRCGLFIHPYFSALKLRWLLDNVPSVAEAARTGDMLCGTVDTWLIWHLTAGASYVTDVSNASRTLLMNLRSMDWDRRLLNFFKLDPTLLARICSSSEIYGSVNVPGSAVNGVPISGCLGDQQAALVGEGCFEETSMKNTYGTGCFLLANTGRKPVFSKHGLLTTVAYKFGPNAPAVYALEGSVAVAGQAIDWLGSNLGLFDTHDQCDELLSESQNVNHNMTESCVYFVPAFSGLYAPYWHAQARGVILGLTAQAGRAQLVRAAFEAVCFQTRDIVEAVCRDSGHAPSPTTAMKLLADGGLTKNDHLMQMQADLLGCAVRRAQMSESTALGAAIAAGLAQGVSLWSLQDVIDQAPVFDEFRPKLNAYERDFRYLKWKDAVERSKNWTKSARRCWTSLELLENLLWPMVVPGAAFLSGIAIAVLVQRCACKS